MTGATPQPGVRLDVAEAAAGFVPCQQGCGTRTLLLVPPRALTTPGVAREEGGRGEPPRLPTTGWAPSIVSRASPEGCVGVERCGWVWVGVSVWVDCGCVSVSVWMCGGVGVGVCVAVCRGLCVQICVRCEGSLYPCVFVRGGCTCVCVRGGTCMCEGRIHVHERVGGGCIAV